MYRTLRTLGAVAALTLAPWALAFEINDIRIEGLKRVSAERVLSALPVFSGDTYTQTLGAATIREVFELGFFRNVEIRQDGQDLVVVVEERPAIARIVVSGNELIPDESLESVLDRAGLREGEVLLNATLDRIRSSLQREYENQGRYNARVEARTVTLVDNRVGIEIDIVEGEVAEIERIRLLGVAQLDLDDVQDEMELTEPGAFTFFTKSHRFSQEKLRGDVERIRSLYLESGFARVEVTAQPAQLDPISQKVSLVIQINEGQRFELGALRLAGAIPEDAPSIELTSETGDLFTQTALVRDIEAIRDRLGSAGYTRAEVREVLEFDEALGLVDVTYLIDPQVKNYVRRINFKGNLTTTDRVLRRNLIQMEGAVADTDKIAQSRRRIQRLGYFARVEPQLVPVPGSTDQVDLEVQVEERATGSFTASIGYSQSSGTVFGLGLSQDNFLGSGNDVSVAFNRSDSVDEIRFSFFDPFFTVDGVSRGISLFYRATDFEEEGSSSYNLDEAGLSLNFGYPITESQRINFGLGFLQTDLTVGSQLERGEPGEVQQIRTFRDEAQGDSYAEFQGSLSWSRSTLNRGFFPTDGAEDVLSLDVSLPGSDLTYYEVAYRGERYFPVNESTTDAAFRLRSRVAYGDGFGDLSTLPFFRNYFAGGERSIRGFAANSLGPREIGQNATLPNPDAIGGNLLILAGAEYQFSAPFIENADSNRIALFVDAGQVYDASQDIEFDELRASAGLSFSWLTAIGPLTFSWATPIQSESGDDTESFQFSIGTGL